MSGALQDILVGPGPINQRRFHDVAYGVSHGTRIAHNFGHGLTGDKKSRDFLRIRSACCLQFSALNVGFAGPMLEELDKTAKELNVSR